MPPFHYLQDLKPTAYNFHAVTLPATSANQDGSEKDTSTHRHGTTDVLVESTGKTISVPRASVRKHRSATGMVHAVLARRPFLEWILTHPSCSCLLPEMAKHVISFLLIDSLSDATLVSAISASSSAPSSPLSLYSFHPRATLTPGTDDCWISGRNPLVAIGAQARPEWIVYDFGTSRPVQCRTIKIRIPSLPVGPLSVRKFHLESGSWDAAAKTWHEDSRTPELETLDVDDLQFFALDPPLETQFIRLVCLQNASKLHDAIGFWEIAFA